MRFPTYIVCLLLAALPLQAAVYKWIDAKGQIHYGDQWREGASAVDLPEPSVYTPRPVLPQSTKKDEADLAGAYDLLQISSPAEDETVRNNEGKVSVSLRVEPTLRQGDVIELLLDGQPVAGRFRSTAATLSNLERGTHTLMARVLDSKGRELVSSTLVNFHMRRESKLFPNRAKPTPFAR